jgi:Cu/Ag efflux pump CusA
VPRFGLDRLATASMNSPGWMMTVAVIRGGLLPIMWTTGTGADVMKRIAAPMIGGMVSSTVLTLLVIPVLYAPWRWRAVRRLT